tara:strand:- start:747 stop:980 length:234 start_codon:yes stop_codon:yes gene_type:complete
MNNYLSIHRVTDIEISTKSLDKKEGKWEDMNNIVNLVITGDDDTRFEISCFLDDEKGFKALDLKALFSLIQKHTVIE